MTKEIPNVLRFHDPIGEAAPAVFDSPHSGLGIPDDFGCLPDAEALRGSGVDNHVDGLFQGVTKHGAAFLEALFLRSYIDPNRDEDEIDPDMLDAPWPGPLRQSERVKMGSSLIWKIGPPELHFYDRKLTVAEVKSRIETYWRPYQTTLKETLDGLHERFGQVWHFNCHSNRTYGTPNALDGLGTKRPEMEIGTLDGAACEPGYTELVRETLAGFGYQVEVDGFFKGNHLVRAYSDPAKGRHSMMLEVRKNLYMDEETLEPNAGFAEVQANMSKLARAICDYARSKTA
jgi:N-formylglutamate amidohydrolase